MLRISFMFQFLLKVPNEAWSTDWIKLYLIYPRAATQKINYNKRKTGNRPKCHKQPLLSYMILNFAFLYRFPNFSTMRHFCGNSLVVQ